MSLYNISIELKRLINDIEEIAVHEELTEEQKEAGINDLMMKYNSLSGSRDEKALDLVRFYKSELAYSKMIDEEMKALKMRKDLHKKKADSVKKFLGSIIDPGNKLEDATAKIGWRKSSSVDYDEMAIDKLPAETLKTTITVNKTELKKYINIHGDSEHYRIVESMNLQLK